MKILKETTTKTVNLPHKNSKLFLFKSPSNKSNKNNNNNNSDNNNNNNNNNKKNAEANLRLSQQLIPSSL